VSERGVIVILGQTFFGFALPVSLKREKKAKQLPLPAPKTYPGPLVRASFRLEVQRRDGWQRSIS
jgi:hypothetical protein